MQNAFAAFCGTGVPGAIPAGPNGSQTPGAPFITTITVPATATETITDLNFDLAITHTWVGDLTVTLTSPMGTTVTLLDRPGRPASTWGCSRDNVNVSFDDEAAAAAEDACAVGTAISGSLRPFQPLSAFDGEPIAGTWTLTATDVYFQDLGTVTSLCTAETTTNPIALNSFESKKVGSRIITDWQTASENQNLGFYVLARINGEWEQTNQRLIKSKIGETLKPQDYRHKIRVNSLPGEVEALGLSAISTSGQEEFYGPFAVGEEYGEYEVPDYIDWEKQQEEYAQRMNNSGYALHRNVWIPVNNDDEQTQASNNDQAATNTVVSEQVVDESDSSEVATLDISTEANDQLDAEDVQYGVANVRVEQDGMYRISIANINETGLDWSTIEPDHIALTYKGNALPRIINVANEQLETEIIFYAQLAQGRDGIYLADNAYQLSVDLEKVIDAEVIQREVESGNQHYLHTQEIEEDRYYNFGIKGDDPWFDNYIFAVYSPRSHIVNLDVEEDADLTQQAYLTLDMVGGLDFEAKDVDGDGDFEPDHHVKVYVNRATNSDPIAEEYLEGKDLWNIKALIPANYLQPGDNEIEIELIPDNGHYIDLVFLDSVRVDYYRPAVLSTESLGFVETDGADAYQFVIGASDKIDIYASSDNGSFSQISYVKGTDSGQILFPSASGGDNQYWLVGEQGYLEPSVIYQQQVVDQDALSLSGVDYVIIADPSLIGSDLQRFADFHNDNDRVTKVVNADLIFTQYGFAMKLPEAITLYLQEQDIVSNYQYVLLVGGHTFNYLGHGQEEGAESLNLIPTFYRSTGDNNPAFNIPFTPSEVPFVDFDHDGTPDKAIGRWPVRSTSELANIVDKTLTWHQTGSIAENKSALLIGEAHDGVSDFKASLESLIPSFGDGGNAWVDISKIYMDEINADINIAAGQKINYAKSKITEAFDAASGEQQTITVFAGHGSPTRWANQNLMTPSFAKTLMNTGAPSLMLPLACYTSYYETPDIESLAHSMLFSGQNAAVGISSAAVLSNPIHSEEFASLLIEKMAKQNQPIGNAVLQIKQQLMAASNDYIDITLNWTTLADPTLSFNQVPIEDGEEAEAPDSDEESER